MSDDRLITLVQNTLIRTVSLIDGTVRMCKASDQALEDARHAAESHRARQEVEIAHQLEQSLSSGEQQYKAITTQASERCQAQYAQFNLQADEQRASILDEQEGIQSRAAKAAEDARWTTESEYETRIDDADQGLERATRHLDEANWRRDSVLAAAAEWRTTLRMQPFEPSTEAEMVHSMSHTAVEDVDACLNQAENCLAGIQATGRRRVVLFGTQVMALIVPLGVGVGIGVLTEQPVPAIAAGVVVGLLILIGVRLQVRRGRRQLIVTAEQQAIEGVLLAHQRQQIAMSHHESVEADSRHARDHKHELTREQLAERIVLAGPRAQKKLKKLDSVLHEAISKAKSKRVAAEDEAKATRETSIAEARTQAQVARQALAESTDATIHAASELHNAAWDNAILNWESQQEDLQADLKRISRLQTLLAPHWPSWDADWRSHTLPTTFAGDIGIGQIRCDLDTLPSGLPLDSRLAWTGPERLELPAAIDFKGRGSLLIEASEQSHGEGVAIMQALIARVLTTIPPGQVRLTLYDPIGLGQNFAGFMHLADSDDTSILERIWTEARHLETKLNDITEHMETVIQAYLRNEYNSLEDYNRAAGEIAEPYHLLVLADFPEGITENAAKRLASILTSGPRCGVFTCLLADSAKKQPPLLQDLDWAATRVCVTRDNGRWQITQPPLGDFEFIPDQPPEDATLTAILQRVGELASGAHRVEVPFELIAPTAEERWTRSSTDELRVTLGQSGANRFQEIRLGRGTTQHALVAGRTGSGKSTLLHVLITNMALWYSPEELEFHLVDFKKGVEFQTYAAHTLPHARVVAIESDREFGLSVLRRLDEELRRRGDLFRDLGVQNVTGWRSRSDEPMPRVLLIVDEFQEFFVDDDALAQEAGLLLDRLVRQGRAFGMHVLMGSQTLDGAFSLARSTLGQMGVRIALQCAEADSYLILSDENPAARLLRRPGEAIYNDAGGKIEGNSPFQVVWLDDGQRDEALDAVAALDAARFPDATRDQFVFKGNIPSLLHSDKDIEAMVAASDWPAPAPLDLALGDPIAIKSQTILSLRARSGCNTLLVGQHPESGNALLCSSLLQAAALLPPTDSPDQPGLMVWIFDGTPSDALFAGRLARFGGDLPHQVTRVNSRNIETEMQVLADILAARADGDHTGRATILLLGLHAHRLAALRAAEDDFSYSSEEVAAKPDRQFADILRDGPIVGMHALLWFDGLNNLNRCLSRANQREFDLKVLFQMSANDSGQLIDTTAAADLGASRAILHADDVGSIEKFRPWAMPDDLWLAEVAARLSSRRARS